MQICHCNVDLDIHHTSGHQERMALLRRACQYHHAAIEQSVPILQQYSFVGLKMQHVQHPICFIEKMID